MESANVNMNVDDLFGPDLPSPWSTQKIVEAMIQDLANRQGPSRILGRFMDEGRLPKSNLNPDTPDFTPGQGRFMDEGRLPKSNLNPDTPDFTPGQGRFMDEGRLPKSNLNPDTPDFTPGQGRFMDEGRLPKSNLNPDAPDFTPGQDVQPSSPDMGSNSGLGALQPTECQQSNASQVASQLPQTHQSGAPVDQSSNGMELLPNGAEELSTNHQSQKPPVRPHFMTTLDPQTLDSEVQLHRNRAAVSEATCTWIGQVPPRTHQNPSYSQKVFVGGLSWDITEDGLEEAFNCFGNLEVEWPEKYGFVYLVFDMAQSVHSLLQACTRTNSSGEYYYRISSQPKEVQIIPWVIEDSYHGPPPPPQGFNPDPCKTVFVGALHGMMTAEMLFNIMQDLFGNVVCSGIDVHKNQIYPIGSGCVTFRHDTNYNRAVQAGVIEVKTNKFTKKIQVDPYFQGGATCSKCSYWAGTYLCRACYCYFCWLCWYRTHNPNEIHRHHVPLTLNSQE